MLAYHGRTPTSWLLTGRCKFVQNISMNIWAREKTQTLKLRTCHLYQSPNITISWFYPLNGFQITGKLHRMYWHNSRGQLLRRWVGDFEIKIPASACRKKNCVQHKWNKKFLHSFKKQSKKCYKISCRALRRKKYPAHQVSRNISCRPEITPLLKS